MPWREVAVRINDGKRSGEDRSKKHKVSFEDVLGEAVERGMFRHESNSSWRSLVKKTKSRLIDPPEAEEHDLGSNRELRSEDDVDDNPEELKSGKHSTSTVFQWVSLVLLLAALFCTLVLPVMKKQILWDLPLWKWEILILALICGSLVSGWLIRIAVILIEHNFLLHKRVLYFVYGLRKAVKNFVWLSLVLLVWHCLFGDNKEAKSSILPYVSKVLVCLLVATFIWLLKILLVKVLASSFHVNTFFDRIQDNLFNQYVIETLSLPPMFGNHNPQEAEASASNDSALRECLLPIIGKNSQDEEMRIDKLSHTNISAWNMRKMMNIIRHGSLSTLDEKILNSDESSVQIRSECQATEAAKRIFHNVAKPGSDYICMDDVMEFMSKDEAWKTMHHLGATTKHERISKSSFRNWVVNVFKERRALALSLNDTKTSVDELHKILDILISIIITIISLVILGIPITHFLVFISSQLLLVVFIFGNTCRTVFEAIIFLFVMHPFDVGDSCHLDGEQMIVEEMNILTTVFMTPDGQKIMYPNSVLATKSIVNHYRSPEMVEAIDLRINIGTPMEKIERMKERLRECVRRNGEHWHPDAMVVVREVDEMGRIKVSLWAKHRINQQNGMERWSRRSRLVEEMIMVTRELNIDLASFPPLPNLNA